VFGLYVVMGKKDNRAGGRVVMKDIQCFPGGVPLSLIETCYEAVEEHNDLREDYSSPLERK